MKQIAGVACIASSVLAGLIVVLFVHSPAAAAALATLDVLIGIVVYRSGTHDIRAATPVRIINFPADPVREKASEKEHIHG